jgi:hypothetical protein
MAASCINKKIPSSGLRLLGIEIKYSLKTLNLIKKKLNKLGDSIYEL